MDYRGNNKQKQHNLKLGISQSKTLLVLETKIFSDGFKDPLIDELIIELKTKTIKKSYKSLIQVFELEDEPG
ncbi:hypothetical protein SAMN05518672_110119 [Chitinophaga sp. CF118]|uniref:hypothetical protein n=1 Tax=Chitinophaga sp. CF118 TaxID=1884367 RepID=UPI0008F2241B|nr:hypothetical protein [Chitinophaga sp. CF118]SFE79635.1 hypothetical protein SAMN05518672_110119 [Chitinophaga sp. CF118]